MFIAITKEILVSLIIKIRSLSYMLLRKRYADEIHNLKDSGIHIVPDYLSKDKCKQLRDKIDVFIENKGTNVWQDDDKADNRIYFINDLDEEFNEFYQTPYFKDILKSYLGTAKPKGMLLAARIDHIGKNKGSGGGWHRDSPFTNQFKAICYLSDVDSESGPFQVVKGSHNTICTLKAIVTRIFKPSQYRYTEAEVDKYNQAINKEVYSVIAPQGSLVLADTKIIHRGKPIEKGSRYVLFCYFWHSDIPEHFKSLRQNSECLVSLDDKYV